MQSNCGYSQVIADKAAITTTGSGPEQRMCKTYEPISTYVHGWLKKVGLKYSGERYAISIAFSGIQNHQLAILDLV